ncbi:hypothetical protein B7494_g5175 [Chlorociboria aeruginascens]|nr:hypothetical protein B7494_g5175 [Chlorociboria aeruginascens]
MSILPLPADVVAQIKSSATITSLNGVIFELLKNSLDAESTKVEISVDYSRGGCIVEDDGLGILPSEFGENGGLGELYHSSKFNDTVPSHGTRGTLLASLSALSLLSITSRHYLHHSHNSISLHKSEVIARQTPASPQQYLSHFDHGTRVTVRDLFGSMPVRVKQRVISSAKPYPTRKLWESLKRGMVLLLLCWPRNVSVTIRELGTNQNISLRGYSGSKDSTTIGKINIASICSILSQASLVSPMEKLSWIPVHASTTKLEVNGAVSLEPCATKQVQFLAFGIQPVGLSEGQNLLYDEINGLFSNSLFGNLEVQEIGSIEMERKEKDKRYKGNGFTTKELKGVRKGVDRWPMFYINIHGMDNANDLKQPDIDEVLNNKGGTLDAVIELLHAVIREFLTSNYFLPRATRGHSKRQLSSNPPEAPNSLISLHGGSESSPIPRLSNRSSGREPCQVGALGADVKLPSFRHSTSMIEFPFNEWSRIKSGTLASTRLNPSIQQPLEPTHSYQASKIVDLKTSTRSTPLVFKSGKLIRKPFEDVTKELYLPIKPQTKPFEEETIEINGDEVIAWVNPITKVRSLVNSQSGLIIPTRKATEDPLVGSPSSQERLSQRKKLNSTPSGVLSPWLSDVLKRWNNPVFCPTQKPIPQVSLDVLDTETENVMHGRYHNCSQFNIEQAFKETSSGLNGRISKDALRNAEIISQVDHKFILVKLPMSKEYQSNLLVIIDQHAADERIRIEQLLTELCTPPNYTTPGSGILTAALLSPISYDLSPEEIHLFHTHIPHFENWGILYDLQRSAPNQTGSAGQKIVVKSLPPGIFERCRNDPKILIDLLRTEVYIRDERSSTSEVLTRPDIFAEFNDNKWLSKIHDCPRGILDLLNSRACRSAIMFNDVLPREQCEIMIRKLAECKFPFQCAHGRLSLVPLLDLGRLNSVEIEQEREGGFGRAFARWKKET